MKWVGLFLCAALAFACDHDLGPPPAGQTIAGTLTYNGTVGSDFEDPAFLIVATTSADPDVIPHALKVIRVDDPNVELDYELLFLPNGRYFVTASLVDIADFDPLTAPVGAYPDNCVLTDMPMGRSLTVEGVPLDGIDITVIDNVFDDECFASAVDLALDECPSANRMSVGLTIESSTPAPTEGADRLVLGLFDEFPPADGAERIVARPGDFEFGSVSGLNEREPGMYFIYACYDVDGNNTEGVCGDEDRFAVTDMAVDLDRDLIHRFSVDLDAGSITFERSDMPDEVACMPDATLAVEVTAATELIPEPGDTLNITVFRDFPGMRDPDYLSQTMPTSFPTLVDIAVDADDYFVVVCFQKADSTSEACAGPGDRLAFLSLTEQVAVPSGETVRVAVELP